MEYAPKYLEELVRIAANIRRLRVNKGYSQEHMLEFGFERRYYQRLEKGEVSPTLHTLFRIAEALEVRLKDLVK